MRLLLGGGGSGGHVFPALAVASTLRDCIGEELELLYVGTESGVEASIARDAAIPFAAVASRPVRGRNALSKLWSAATIAQGVWTAVKIMRRFQPHVVLLTGGYASVPVGVAAKITRRPTVLFQPDIVPGWAVRFLGRLATQICVTDAHSLRWWPTRKSVATGYPVRAVFRDLDRPIARARFQLNGEPAVLVTGAVQGARRINDLIDADLEEWLAMAQLIHITGRADAKRMSARREALPPELKCRYQVYEYLGDELPIAMAACDIAISRAGASVLGEYPAAELPSVLMPLPMAGGHQHRNADILVEAGAAIIVEDDVVATDLLPAVQALLRDPERLAAMRRQAAVRARPDAAVRVAEALWEARK